MLDDTKSLKHSVSFYFCALWCETDTGSYYYHHHYAPKHSLRKFGFTLGFFFYYHSFFSYLHLLNFGTCTLTLFNNKHALHLWYVMSLILLFFDEIVWNLYCWHILRVTTLICLAWSKIQNHQPARACLCPSFWLDKIKTSITF